MKEFFKNELIILCILQHKSQGSSLLHIHSFHLFSCLNTPSSYLYPLFIFSVTVLFSYHYPCLSMSIYSTVPIPLSPSSIHCLLPLTTYSFLLYPSSFCLNTFYFCLSSQHLFFLSLSLIISISIILPSISFKPYLCVSP